MKKYRLIILVIVIFTLCNIFNSTSYASQAVYDADGIAQQLVDEGIAKGIIDTMIKKNLLSEEVMEPNHGVKGFQHAYDKNYDLGFLREVLDNYDYTFKGTDEYLENLFNIYKSIVIEMQKNEKLKPLFDLAKVNYVVDGGVTARAFIETIAIKVLDKKVEEAQKAYKKDCYIHYGSNKKQFTYDGISNKCSDVYYEFAMIGELFGLEQFNYRFRNLASAATTNYMSSRLYSVKEPLDETISNVYIAVTGKVPPKRTDLRSQGTISGDNTNIDNENNDDNNNKENDISLNYIDGESNYYPRLTNAFRFAKEFSDVGGLDSLLTGKTDKNTGMLEVVNQITTGFGKIGTYVMYGLIIMLGVVAIWSGVNGKVRFSETLPYVVVAIILFYAAPGIISIIKDIYTGANQSELWFDNMVKNLFATLINIIRTIAFMGIILNGIKLMFGGAKEKANVKSSVVPLFVGSILVFAASIVVSFTLTTAHQAGVNTETDINSVTTNKGN